MPFLRLAPLLLTGVLGCAQIHKVPVSASWFPADPQTLTRLLDRAWEYSAKRTGPAPPRRGLRALITPHAGLVYSGVVAASAYRRLGAPPNVIVLAFSHSRRLEGIVAPNIEAYETPVGRVQVNREAIRKLGVRFAPEAEVCDHSLENQLPFIRRAAPKAAVIPLLVGQLTENEGAAAAKKLAGRLKNGDVIVASSDLTHYGPAYRYEPFPNDAALPRRLLERAMNTFEQVGSLHAPSFDRYISDTGDTVCGWAPIRLMMAALAQSREEIYSQPLDYLASGQLTNDYSNSVSYGAQAFYAASAFGLQPQDGEKLLWSARKTLEAYLAKGEKLRVPVPADERGPDLQQRSGVFVTIRKDGELRGCIGALSPARPLWDAVSDRTLAAAAEDPRFPPLTAKEGPVTLEVSILTPLRRLSNWRDFQIGQGGVILLDKKSGILLPQVAREMNWTRREQFLENLCLKAGLDRRAYKDPKAVLYVYSAHVYTEPAN